MKIISLTGKAKSGKDSFARISSSYTQTWAMGISDNMKRMILDSFGFTVSDVFGNGSTKECGYEIHPKEEFFKFGLTLVAKPWAYVEQKLNSNRIFTFTTENALEYDSRIFSYPEEDRWVHFVAPGHPRFWMSPREAMQNLGSELETISAQDFIAPLLRSIHCMLGSSIKFGDKYTSSQAYDRKLGIFDWRSESNREPVVVITDVRKPHQLLKLKSEFPGIISVMLIRKDATKVINHESEAAVDEFHPSDFDTLIYNDGDYLSYKTKVLSLLSDVVGK